MTQALSGSAPGKAILFGEHAVVYGQPAIAVPVTEVQAIADIHPDANAGGLWIDAHDLGWGGPLAWLPRTDPIAAIVWATLQALGLDSPPKARLVIRSSIPIASGLGSGAAVSTAVVRALCRHAARWLDDETVSALVYEVEKIHHGTPSGIDNTVVVFGQPIYFERGRPVQRLTVPRPFRIAIADTGVASPTKLAVADVRRAWERAPGKLERIFGQIGRVVRAGRAAIAAGAPERLGELMVENQDYLRMLEVSSPELERLIAAARSAGASGAKLSGGGRGGNMLALVDAETAPAVEAALRRAGAVRVIVTEVR